VSGTAITDLMAGDVVIWCREGVFECYVAVVLYDGERPECMAERWQPRTASEATAFAREWIRWTKGRVLTWNGAAVRPLTETRRASHGREVADQR
jgi:hypothetical protein